MVSSTVIVKRVVDRHVVDVGRRDTRLLEGGRARPDGAGDGEVDPPVVGVLERLAVAEELHAPAARGRARPRGDDHDERAAAVGDHAAVEPVERVADHRRRRAPPRP